MRQVQPEDTVQWQMDQILAKNSPLMRRARTGALQQMNERGLLNSSIAVEAGQNAVIANALPIASQDANTYFSQGINNQNTTNRFRENDQIYLQNSALSEQSFGHNMQLALQKFGFDKTLLSMSLKAGAENAYLAAYTAIMTTPGTTPQQSVNAINDLNTVTKHSPQPINSYSNMQVYE